MGFHRYLINFLLDATLGMLVIWAGVKVVSRIVEYKQFTLLTFGEYGESPRHLFRSCQMFGGWPKQ